jgi:hypothetical protein
LPQNPQFTKRLHVKVYVFCGQIWTNVNPESDLINRSPEKLIIQTTLKGHDVVFVFEWLHLLHYIKTGCGKNPLCPGKKTVGRKKI